MKPTLFTLLALLVTSCQTTGKTANTSPSTKTQPSLEKSSPDIPCPPKKTDGSYDYSNYSDTELVQIMQHGCKK